MSDNTKSIRRTRPIAAASLHNSVNRRRENAWGRCVNAPAARTAIPGRRSASVIAAQRRFRDHAAPFETLEIAVTTLTPSLIESLKSLDTPTVCNALELLAPQRRGWGYTVEPLVCVRPTLPP